MEVLRSKVECLRFIPNSEVRVQYVDGENTLVNVRANDSFMDALRCAVTVPGATQHRKTFTVKNNTRPFKKKNFSRVERFLF